MEIKLWTEEEIRELTDQVFRDNGITDNLPEIFYTNSRGSWAQPRRNRIKHPYWMITGKYTERGGEVIDVPETLIVYEFVQSIVIHEACHIIHHRTDPKDQGAHGHGQLFKEIESRELMRYDIACKYSRAYAHTLYRISDGEILWSRDVKQIGSFIPQKRANNVEGYLFTLSRQHNDRR